MKKIILIIITVLVFSSCEKLFFEKDLQSVDPYVNFDYLWSQIDQKYSYFTFKDVNWDEVKVRYRAQLSKDMSQEALFDVMANMMNELKDDHTNLISDFNISRYDLPLLHESNYSEHVVQKYYIPNYKTIGGFTHNKILNSNIGYIRYSSFSNEITPEQMSYLTNYYKDTDGLILDLRYNGGGSVTNIPIILEAFSNARTLAAYTIHRNGPGRDEFGNRETIHILKGSGLIYQKPVMVLIDRYSYSATTFFSVCTKAFDHIQLVGDTTGGGGGLPNGGQLPNGWFYRFSVSQILDLQGNNYAESGVPPDFVATFNWNDMTKDEIIEAAIDIIYDQKKKGK